MSRRDTILAAVLINTALLALLFMMAINPEDDLVIEPVKETLVVQEPQVQPVQIEPTPMTFAKSAVADEVDQALMNFSEPKQEPYVDITVKRGDMLEKIARANGTTVATLKKINDLKNEKLSIGQVLRVPVAQEKKEEPVIAQKEEKEDEPQYYTIQSGDNPWKVAKQFHVRFYELLELNDLNEEKARNLKVGDKIRVH